MRRLTLFILTGLLWFGPAHDASAQSSESWFHKGNELSRQGRFKEAVEAYQQSILLNPATPVTRYNMGIAYKNLRRYEDAAKAFEKVVEMEPGNLDAQLSLGNAYNYLERWRDAIGPLNLVVHRRRNDAEAHGNLGWAYYNFKDGPTFKFLVILNLKKATDLFEEQNMPEAAEATRKILEEALEKFVTPSGE
ncbi:MAG: tetratricopeptide repeat protein [Nitrospinaceae bacterium]